MCFEVGILIGYQQVVDSRVKESVKGVNGVLQSSHQLHYPKPMIYVGWMEIGYDACKTEEVFICKLQLPSQWGKYKNTNNVLFEIYVFIGMDKCNG